MLTKLPADATDALIWSVLLHDVGKPPTAARDPEGGAIHFYGHEKVGAALAEVILRRLRFPRREIQAIVTAVARHMQFKDVPQMRAATVRRLLLRPTFPLELELHRLDCLGSHGDLSIHSSLQAESDRLRSSPALRPPLLTGRDLLALGAPAGPQIGSLLSQARELQLQGDLGSREEALAWARRQLRRAGGEPPPSAA
jgi:poly(A) polymerase